ncbi:hypothetical protein GOBAR_DD22273 [Gossypium barbadense]|nr:hypothetical protein GOBAR_DD22273 [Gossypium barbadense]
MLSFTSGVILPSSGVVKSSGKLLEKLLKDHAGKYATGDEVSMADLFLAPQILAGIERFNVDMDNLETLLQEDIQADLVCCLQHLQLPPLECICLARLWITSPFSVEYCGQNATSYSASISGYS